MKIVRMGILGCGRIALSTHIPTLLRHPNVQIVALAEPSEHLRMAALSLARGAVGTPDWHDVIAHPEVDAVLIALPTHLHAEAAIAAFELGKHVYLEKPIASTLAQGRQVARAWERSRCIGMTGFNYRFHPMISALKREIRSGRIGQVIAARGTFTTPDEQLPAWKLSRATGGGALLDLGSHHIDLLHYLLDAETQSVQARIGTIQSEADTATLDIELSGAITAQLMVCLRSVAENRIEIFGTKGKLAVDCYRSVEVECTQVHGGKAGGRLIGLARRAGAVLTSKVSGSPMHQSYRFSLDAFVSAVRTGNQPECDLNAGQASLAVIDAAERSAQSGANEFIGTLVPRDPAPAPTLQLQVDPDMPSLTVVAVTMDGYETIRETVRHLAAQTIHEQMELLICAPSRDELQLNQEDMTPFHSFRVFEVGTGRTMSAAKLPAIAEARAPIVIFSEDHSFPEPAWGEQLVAAHARGAVATGPQIRNANPQSMISWADLFLGFGRWVEPLPHGPSDSLPWHNSAYDRRLLLSLGEDLEALLENEGLLQERIRASGKQMVLIEACTRHVNITRFGSFCSGHYHGGRSFGAGRASDGRWGLIRRAVHVLGAPLVPVVRLRASLNLVAQCGRTRQLVPGMLPFLLLGLCCHAFGEAMGIGFGSGISRQRKSDLEFHRDRHVSDADAIALGFGKAA